MTKNINNKVTFQDGKVVQALLNNEPSLTKFAKTLRNSLRDVRKNSQKNLSKAVMEDSIKYILDRAINLGKYERFLDIIFIAQKYIDRHQKHLVDSKTVDVLGDSISRYALLKLSSMNISHRTAILNRLDKIALDENNKYAQNLSIFYKTQQSKDQKTEKKPKRRAFARTSERFARLNALIYDTQDEELLFNEEKLKFNSDDLYNQSITPSDFDNIIFDDDHDLEQEPTSSLDAQDSDYTEELQLHQSSLKYKVDNKSLRAWVADDLTDEEIMPIIPFSRRTKIYPSKSTASFDNKSEEKSSSLQSSTLPDKQESDIDLLKKKLKSKLNVQVGSGGVNPLADLRYSVDTVSYQKRQKMGLQEIRDKKYLVDNSDRNKIENFLELIYDFGEYLNGKISFKSTYLKIDQIDKAADVLKQYFEEDLSHSYGGQAREISKHLKMAFNHHPGDIMPFNMINTKRKATGFGIFDGPPVKLQTLNKSEDIFEEKSPNSKFCPTSCCWAFLSKRKKERKRGAGSFS